MSGYGYYSTRPPATCRVARKIWDALTQAEGHEPRELWHNGNGIVFGLRLCDAWYSAWLYYSGRPGSEHDEFVPEVLAARCGARGLLYSPYVTES